MAVNSGAHVLPGHNSPDLLLRRDVLPASGLPQGVEGEGSIPIHLRPREELSGPVVGGLDSVNITETYRLHPSVNAAVPLQVKLQVSEDAPGWDKGAGNTGQDLPAAEVPRTAWLRWSRRLLDQLTVELIPQRLELLAGLQDALDHRHRVGHSLQVLQRAEHLEGLVLQRGVASAPWS